MTEDSLSFEAVKVSMLQDKDGFKLILRIHPDDVPRELFTSWVGSRFGVAMVPINDEMDADTKRAAKQIKKDQSISQSNVQRFNLKLDNMRKSMTVKEWLAEGAPASNMEPALVLAAYDGLDSSVENILIQMLRQELQLKEDDPVPADTGFKFLTDIHQAAKDWWDEKDF